MLKSFQLTFMTFNLLPTLRIKLDITGKHASQNKNPVTIEPFDYFSYFSHVSIDYFNF